MRKDGSIAGFSSAGARYEMNRDASHVGMPSDDIEERKQAEQRLQNENVALREEIARASMFEEIVEFLQPLHACSLVSPRLLPTDHRLITR